MKSIIKSLAIFLCMLLFLSSMNVRVYAITGEPKLTESDMRNLVTRFNTAGSSRVIWTKPPISEDYRTVYAWNMPALIHPQDGILQRYVNLAIDAHRVSEEYARSGDAHVNDGMQRIGIFAGLAANCLAQQDSATDMSESLKTFGVPVASAEVLSRQFINAQIRPVVAASCKKGNIKGCFCILGGAAVGIIAAVCASLMFTPAAGIPLGAAIGNAIAVGAGGVAVGGPLIYGGYELNTSTLQHQKVGNCMDLLRQLSVATYDPYDQRLWEDRNLLLTAVDERDRYAINPFSTFYRIDESYSDFMRVEGLKNAPFGRKYSSSIRTLGNILHLLTNGVEREQFDYGMLHSIVNQTNPVLVLRRGTRPLLMPPPAHHEAP